MKIIDHFQELDACISPVVTSGTFDGVHSGHLKILGDLVQQAQARGGESVVITYWPHPRFVLGKEKNVWFCCCLEEIVLDSNHR